VTPRRDTLPLGLVCAAGLAAALASCNPYDALPRARCRSAGQCLPGELCADERCHGPRRVGLVVARARAPLHALVLALPRGQTDPLGSDDARLLGARQLRAAGRGGPAVAQATFEELPRLPLWVLVWAGEQQQPCAGDRFVLERTAGTDEVELTLIPLRTWRGFCAPRPVALDYIDHGLFARAR